MPTKAFTEPENRIRKDQKEINTILKKDVEGRGYAKICM